METRYETSPINEVRRADGALKKIRVQDGQLFVCHGCCCGRAEKGFPALPLEELKRQWKARGIRRRFHLTISGCLGPCSLANVVLILFHGSSVWLHSIVSEQDVTEIFDYVEQMLVARRYLEPPPSLAQRHFQRYLVESTGKLHCEIEEVLQTSHQAGTSLPEICLSGN